MKLGFLTACLPEQPLEAIAPFAAAVGYEALEIAAWPALDNRPFTATHVVVDPLAGDEIDRVRTCLDPYGLSVSSLAYYGNNLHPDPRRTSGNERSTCCVASTRPQLLGCPTVGSFHRPPSGTQRGRQPARRRSASFLPWPNTPASAA